MKNRKHVVVASGYFNPLHLGHLRYLEEAKKLGDILVVIVNSDIQVEMKGSVPFMREYERSEIIRSLRYVDATLIACDKSLAVTESLKVIYDILGIDVFANGIDVFANGGDATETNCREKLYCEILGIEMVFGVGGDDKIQSSRKLIKALSQH